ncbi:MAG: hypothetical protein FWF53_11700 [Candidatus Azobacteroides sp.]|nr:hypothetical protein [Candidatus Azobacteroides sp.]
MSNAYDNPDFNWRQKELDYFGFEGTYDPDLLAPGQFDSSTQSIKYGKSAFGDNGNSYSRLRAIYEEEKFHSVDYLKYIKEAPDWMKNEPNIKYRNQMLHDFEEWRAQNYLYKNQWLYYNSGIDWIQRINGYGINASLYGTESELFKADWWHFIYKIPRRW